MFRKPVNVTINAPTRTEYVTREIHEHRAPTDESVRLLKEMEEKAEKKVIEAIHIGDTHFECVVHAELDMMSDCTRFVAVFSLNGNKRTVKHEYRIRDRGDEIKAIGELRDKVAQEIADEMILSAFAQMKFAQRFGSYE